MKTRSVQPDRTAINVNGHLVGHLERDDKGRFWAVPDISGIELVRSQYSTSARRAITEYMEIIDIRSRFPSRRAAILYLERLARAPFDLPDPLESPGQHDHPSST